MKKIILCGLAVCFLTWAALAQPKEELKAYYEKQKEELAPTFVAPETGSEIMVVLLDGEERTGTLRQLTDNGIQLLSDGALVTFRKRELTEGTCAKLFAEDYAHAEAIKRTHAYKRGHSARVLEKAHKGTLSGRVKMERDSSRNTEIEESEDGTWTIDTKDYVSTQNLTATLANKTTHPDTFTLKWYFFVQTKDGKKNIRIHSRGSKEFKLEGGQKIQHKIVSEEYALKKVSRGWVACCGKSEDHENVTGEEEKGYLLVLKCDDEILARDASSKRYLHPDWVRLLR